MSDVPCPVQPGDLVSEKYLVDRVLGAGGMGVVVAATQIELDRPVALKFLQRRVADRPELARRFSREARAAAKLHSEHVARVLDVGALASGEPYIVMEYLEGQDLGAMLKASGPLPVVDAVSYMMQAIDAVAEAHSLGIVHRDLKPSNLFVARRPGGGVTLKVLDFGLSKFTAGDEQVTSDSSILGSPLYMSPEQLLSTRTVDARTDIWSLGVVLYELLSAQPPFRSERMPELVTDILHSAPRPIESMRSALPPELLDVIRTCLQKDAALRYPTVAQLAAALAPFGPPGPTLARVVAILGEPPAAHRPPRVEQGFAATLQPQGDLAVVDSVSGAGHTLRSLPASPEGSGPHDRPRRWIALGAAGALVAIGLAFPLSARWTRAVATESPVAGGPLMPPASVELPSSAPTPATALSSASAPQPAIDAGGLSSSATASTSRPPPSPPDAAHGKALTTPAAPSAPSVPERAHPGPSSAPLLPSVSPSAPRPENPLSRLKTL